MASLLTVGASVLGFTGVALGAFGAHALKARLGPEAMGWYQTGVTYHLVHAVALLGAACLAARAPGAWVSAAGGLFAGGVLLFSGSLYGLALTGARALGMVTPLGGLLMLAGWACLGWAGRSL